MAIAREDRNRFGPLFEQRHVLREVCATGPVEKSTNGYVIRVEGPNQLRVQGNLTSVMPFGADSLSICDAGVQLPKVVTEAKPSYTRAALEARVEGSVFLEALVRTDGEIGDIRVLRSLDSRFGLDEQAITALRAWRFAPGTLEGRAVPVVVTVELSFRVK